MPLLYTPPDPILAARNQFVAPVAEALHNLASVMSASNDAFWAQPTDDLLAMLNADIPSTLEIFSGNSELASAINPYLDHVADPRYGKRVPTEPGRADIVFDGQAFVYVAPPEPPPAPEIDPDAPPADPPADMPPPDMMFPDMPPPPPIAP